MKHTLLLFTSHGSPRWHRSHRLEVRLAALKRLHVVLRAVATLLLLAPFAARAADSVVWSTASKNTAKGWDTKGKCSLVVKANAGREGRGALVVHLEGDGNRQAGWNLLGWYPPDAKIDLTAARALALWVRRSGGDDGADIAIQLVDNAGQLSKRAALLGDKLTDKIDGTWRRVLVPVATLVRGSEMDAARFWEIRFQPTTASGTVEIAVDTIALSDEGGLTDKPEPAYPVKVRVAAAQPTHVISEHIYGTAGGKEADLRAWGIASTRWGGNRSTRYNWKLGFDNAAHDWFYLNGGKPTPAGADNGWLAAAKTHHAAGRDFFVTVPTIGWVAKDGGSWGYSVKKYGPQKAAEQWHPDAGNGLSATGKPIVSNDPHDTSVEASPAFVAAGVATLAPLNGKAGRRIIYALDNEPMLWNSTHRDIHPKPLTYDELWSRTVTYGEAVKQADPNGRIAGPVTWGWLDLFYSAADQGNDNYTTKADHKAHGGVPLVAWYLRQMAAYEKTKGHRLLDILTCHYYPQATGVYGGGGGGERVMELRLRSTRSLWDKSYKEESWISGTFPQPLTYLPRLKKWIADEYPGTQLCIGEWNWGGADNASGALAAAEVLGIFGREGVDMAYLWTVPEGSQRRAWDIFRNYDGRGGRFGDQCLTVQSDTANSLSAFAARRGTTGPVTLLLINKDLHRPAATTFSLDGFAPKSASHFRWVAGAADVTALPWNGPVGSTMTLELPPLSMTLLVLPGT